MKPEEYCSYKTGKTRTPPQARPALMEQMEPNDSKNSRGRFPDGHRPLPGPGRAGRVLLSGILALVSLSLLASCRFPTIIIHTDPLTAGEHNNLGYLYEQKGETREALREYEKAARAQKKWWIPPFNIGNILYKEKDYKGAERAYRRAIRLSKSESHPAMNNLANLLREQGRQKEALKWIDRALSLKENSSYRKTREEILSQEPLPADH